MCACEGAVDFVLESGHCIVRGWVSLLSSLLRLEAACAVGDTDRELCGTSDNVAAVLGRDVVGNLRSVRGGVHEEELDVLDVAHDKLEVTRRQHVLGLRVGAVADLGHLVLAAEASSHAVINTLGLAP